ncbi:MAG TPA: SH3 domain-containing protein [Myxococcota bacterium]
MMPSLAYRCLLLAALCAGLVACQHTVAGSPAPGAASEVDAHCSPRAEAEPGASFQPESDADAFRRAEAERVAFFQREVERLRADLRQAEESLVAMESGQRGFQSRADAVSALAEARIALERVSPSVPWRKDRAEEARAKLAEASRQLQAGHLGSAVFFASRAQRITESLQAEVRQVADWSRKSLVVGDEVPLHTGPSPVADVVDILGPRTPVFPERNHADWTLVRTPSGRIGWVQASRLVNP